MECVEIEVQELCCILLATLYTFVSTDQFIVAQTPLRPRVIGASVGYRF